LHRVHSRPEDYDIIIPEAGEGNWGVAIALNRYRWDDDKMVPLGTPYFAGFALEAMHELGMINESLDFIRLRWGDFSRQGATTVWEVWNRENGSLSTVGLARQHLSLADMSSVLPLRTIQRRTI